MNSLLKESNFNAGPLKGHLISKRLAVSLKRYPDTKRIFQETAKPQSFRSVHGVGESRALLKRISDASFSATSEVVYVPFSVCSAWARFFRPFGACSLSGL